MIHVIATVTVHPGKRDALLAELQALVPTVLIENGCIEYGPTLDCEPFHPRQVPVRPEVVTIVEKWRTLDDLKAHLAAPHMAEYREKVKDLVASAQLQITRDV